MHRPVYVVAFALLAGVVVGPWAAPAVRRAWARLPRWCRELLPVAILFAATFSVYGGMLEGRLPLARDHNVHVFKITQLEEMLRTGRLYGWSDAELAGYPHNVMYPFLGYLLVAALDALPGVTMMLAYSWILFIVILGGVLAVYFAGRLHLSPVVGILAGLFALADPGGWMIGGHEWTVATGVWPSSLSVDVVIVVVALLPGALDAGSLRPAVRAGILAALAVLFHPVAILLFTLSAPFLLLARLTAENQQPLSRAFVRGAVFAGATFAASAFWLVPFFRASPFAVEERAWSAFSSTDMWKQLVAGELFAQPAIWTGATVCGLLMLAARRDLFSRFVVTVVVGGVIFSTTEALGTVGLWNKGPRWVIEMLQFRRIYCLIRPMAFLAAAYALVELVPPALARIGAQRVRWQAVVARLVVGGLAALLLLLPGVGAPGLPRDPLPVDLSGKDREDLAKLMARSKPLLGTDGRLVLLAGGSDHSLVGPAALAGIKKIVKVGYTPATRFVNQLATDPATIARVGARAVVTRSPAPADWAGLTPLVEKIGNYELRRMTPDARAWIDGPGTARVDSWKDEEIRIHVEGAEAGSELRLVLGHYDRWRDDRGHPTRPYPYFGMTASSLPARDGDIVLRYVRPAAQWVGLGITAAGALALAGIGLTGLRSRRVRVRRDVLAPSVPSTSEHAAEAPPGPP